MTTQVQTEVFVRWMLRKDLPLVLNIERQCFEFPWSEDDFLNQLRERNCVGMVAEHGEHILGFMLYQLDKSVLHVLNFAVDPGHRRHGVGRQMVEKLIGKLSQQRSHRLALEVRDSNLAAQLFFKEMGFVATGVLPGWYAETGEDAYEFEYVLNECDRDFVGSSMHRKCGPRD